MGMGEEEGGKSSSRAESRAFISREIREVEKDKPEQTTGKRRNINEIRNVCRRECLENIERMVRGEGREAATKLSHNVGPQFLPRISPQFRSSLH